MKYHPMKFEDIVEDQDLTFSEGTDVVREISRTHEIVQNAGFKKITVTVRRMYNYDGKRYIPQKHGPPFTFFVEGNQLIR